MVEFSHNNFLHAQVERSVQYVLGLEPIDLLQPSTQLTVNDCSLRTEHRTQSEQPTSSTHCLLSYVKNTFVTGLAISHSIKVTMYLRFTKIYIADDRYVHRSTYNGCLGAQRPTRVGVLTLVGTSNAQLIFLICLEFSKGATGKVIWGI